MLAAAGTGYAYCFTGSDKIEAKQPGGQDARKNLTCILLNDDSQFSFKSFGYEARRQYSETDEGLFFSCYKMLLANVGGSIEPMVRMKLIRASCPLFDTSPLCA